MRSFAIDEPGSSVRALYATLVWCTYPYVEFVPICTFTETNFLVRSFITLLKDQRPQNLYINVDHRCPHHLLLLRHPHQNWSSRQHQNFLARWRRFIMFRYFLWVSLYVLELVSTKGSFWPSCQKNFAYSGMISRTMSMQHLQVCEMIKSLLMWP